MRVPKQNLVGALNEGWRVAMTTLTYERGISSLATQVRVKQQLDAMTMEICPCDPQKWAYPVRDPVYRQNQRRPISALRLCC